MNVDLLTIGFFVAIGMAVTLLLPGRWRGWFLFAASVTAVYWLQTFIPLRFGDYLLQTATILLTLLTWWVTRPPSEEKPFWAGEDGISLALLLGLVLLVAGNRYLAAGWRFTASRPPSPLSVIAGLALLFILFALAWPWLQRISRHTLLTAVILLIVAIFVLLKAPPLTTAVAAQWRQLTGQQTALAAPSDLAWLGFSYVAFRLIHTLRDRQTGQLPALTLREFVTYVLFFPSYIAGPIDRAERFVADLRAEEKAAPLRPGTTAADYAARYWQAGSRIIMGLFKKFVIADTLALGMSLTPVNAAQATETFWLWLLLYGYALRLYFDFSGYTDIAIGTGLLFGVKLPENFRRPYLSPNITAFWQRWHVSLSDWARFYVFSPLSRSLLRRRARGEGWLRPSNSLIILTSHLSTMAVIGLWHGITLNFFIWGLWHGVALFAHKQWSDRTRAWYRDLGKRPWRKRAWTVTGWFLTFQYVVLGWVWFLLPTPALAGQTLAKLFGFH